MMRSWWAFSLILAAGCGRSELGDELLIDPAFDASNDFDVGVGDDESDDGSVDAGKKPPPMKDASPPKRDAVAPPMDAEPPPAEDAEPPPMRDAGIIPIGDGGGSIEPECDPTRCSTGCCYGNICAQGTQNIACGSNGFACSDCSSFGEICSNRICISPFR
jgi:hypothetical protein